MKTILDSYHILFKGVRADIARPDPKPASNEIKVPAQVGYPTNCCN